MSPRKRWMLQPLSWRRGGAAALVVLVIIAGAALVLDAGAGGQFTPIVERLSDRGVEPAALVSDMAAGAEIMILGDVPGQAAPKRVAAEAVRRLAEGPGLDAVVLAVPASEQRYIDAYLAGAEDDAAALLSREAAVQERFGTARDYLEIYRAVREVNQGLNASQRVRVIAVDVEDWPPPEGAAPRRIGELFAGRAEHMLSVLDQRLFSIMPDARILVFVDGYMAMQGTHGELRFGGGDPVRIQWLGELLRRRSGAGARTILPDAGASASGLQRLPIYHGTRLYRPLRRELSGSVASRVTGDLAEVADPVLELSTPGLTLEILPEGYTLGTAAQGYLFLESGG